MCAVCVCNRRIGGVTVHSGAPSPSSFVILQAKEKLISSLQGGGESVQGVEEARVEEVRLEKEHVQAQLTNTLRQLEDVKKDLQVRRIECTPLGDECVCSLVHSVG